MEDLKANFSNSYCLDFTCCYALKTRWNEGKTEKKTKLVALTKNHLSEDVA